LWARAIAGGFRLHWHTNISDLKGKDPEELYSQICAKQGRRLDRCLLCVCRFSVYFAENENPDFEKLKWWNWKDKKPNYKES